MQSVLRNIPSDSLKVYIVWIPALFSDHRSNAVEATAECTDARARHFWDGEKAVGESYQQWLGIERFAWDVYFVYERGVIWGKDPDPPDPYAWMHQLWGLEEMAPMLDSVLLAQKVEEVLR